MKVPSGDPGNRPGCDVLPDRCASPRAADTRLTPR